MNQLQHQESTKIFITWSIGDLLIVSTAYPGVAGGDGGDWDEPGDENERTQVDFVFGRMADRIKGAA